MQQSNVANLVELIPYAAVLYADEGAILAANAMFGELTGYTRYELERLAIATITYGPDREHDDVARSRLQDGQYMELAYEKRFICKGGRTVRCEVALKRIALDHDLPYLALVRQLNANQPGDLILDSLHGASELILHAIDEGFVLLDSGFRVRCINDEALRLDGRPRSAIVGRTHWDAWPGTEHLPLADAYRKAMRERIHVNIEHAYHYLGRDMWLEARAFPFGDGLAVFYKNITERKLVESAIRESETKFRTIADAIPQIVWSSLPCGFHDYFNRQWYSYTGVADGATNGNGWLDLLHPDDRPALLARWHYSLATGEPYETEYRIRHHSGEYRWTLGRALPVRNAQGEIVRWMGTSTDIHERVLAQAALKDAQARLESALAAAEIGTWTWEVAADRVHADNNLAAMFGVAPQQADNAPLATYMQAVHPDDVARVQAGIDQSLTSGQPCHERFRLHGPDGSIRYMESRAIVASDDNGQPLHMSGAVLDVTRQYLAEQALQQANRRKDDFLAVLAHELRNPLVPISTAAHLLKSGQRNAEHVRRASDIIDRQVRHLSELVNDLMDVSRVTRGLSTIGQEEVRVAAIVTTAVEQSRPLIDARRQTLAINLHDDGAMVLGDPTRLVQVLANLLNNAAKYTQHEGRITLTVTADDGQVHIAVSDNGIGMDAALLPHVFELFTQAERTPDRHEGGLGLGLTLVKSIVALHHGQVSGASAGRGKGSTFTVSLPLLRHAGV